uniref:Uncharacterized protein n=1 Tax=Medicago truncatula TaxID=3880 RepID=I3S2F4_MEDTR|nr:unknown [Medicago truncatula]
MKLSSSTNRFFRSIIPSHTNPHIVPIILLDLLHTCHIGWLTRVRRTHQNTITSFNNLVCSSDCVWVHVLFSWSCLRHV